MTFFVPEFTMPTQSLSESVTVALLLGAFTVLIPGCAEGGGAARQGPFLVRDSSGIVIAESSGSQVRQAVGWTIELDLQIGQVDSDGPDAFAGIRGMRQLSNETIVVLDGGSKELRAFTADGRFLFRAGREGSGPGEFSFPHLVPIVLGDSLLIFDSNHRRFTLYAGDGSAFRPFLPEDLPRDLITGFPVGAMTNALIFRGSSLPSNISSIQGQFELPVSLRWVSRDGSAVDTLIMQQVPQFAARFGGTMYLLDVPFSVRPSVAVGKNGFYVSDGQRILDYSETAELRRIIRLAEESRVVTSAEFRAVAETRITGFQGGTIDLQEVRRTYEQMQSPSLYPLIDALLRDDLGSLWAKTFAEPGSDEVTWWIFNPEGKAMGSFTTPSDFEVYQIGRDFLLGSWRDDLGVEYVRRYSLSRIAA